MPHHGRELTIVKLHKDSLATSPPRDRGVSIYRHFASLLTTYILYDMYILIPVLVNWSSFGIRRLSPTSARDSFNGGSHDLVSKSVFRPQRSDQGTAQGLALFTNVPRRARRLSRKTPYLHVRWEIYGSRSQYQIRTNSQQAWNPLLHYGVGAFQDQGRKGRCGELPSRSPSLSY